MRKARKRREPELSDRLTDLFYKLQKRMLAENALKTGSVKSKFVKHWSDELSICIGKARKLERQAKDPWSV